MEVKEYEELEVLFWEWCKTFKHYESFAGKKRTLKEVLDLIAHDVHCANAQMIHPKD